MGHIDTRSTYGYFECGTGRGENGPFKGKNLVHRVRRSPPWRRRAFWCDQTPTVRFRREVTPPRSQFSSLWRAAVTTTAQHRYTSIHPRPKYPSFPSHQTFFPLYPFFGRASRDTVHRIRVVSRFSFPVLLFFVPVPLETSQF